MMKPFSEPRELCTKSRPWHVLETQKCCCASRSPVETLNYAQRLPPTHFGAAYKNNQGSEIKYNGLISSPAVWESRHSTLSHTFLHSRPKLDPRLIGWYRGYFSNWKDAAHSFWFDSSVPELFNFKSDFHFFLQESGSTKLIKSF